MIQKFIEFLEKKNLLDRYYNNVILYCHKSYRNHRYQSPDWLSATFPWFQDSVIKWYDVWCNWTDIVRKETSDPYYTFNEILQHIDNYLTNKRNKDISIF